MPKRATKKTGLDARDRRILDAYFVNGFVKTAALVKGGYSSGSAATLAHKFFKRPDVIDDIRRRRDAEHEEAIATENEILAILSQQMRAGQILAKFKKPTADGKVDWDFTGATEAELAEAMAVISELATETYIEGKGDDAVPVKRFKIKHADVTSAAQLLMRQKGMLKDKLDLTGEMDIVTVLQQRGRQASGEKAE